MADGNRDGNREPQNLESNDIIRQLFSRIGELSDAISGRPNQVRHQVRSETYFYEQ